MRSGRLAVWTIAIAALVAGMWTDPHPRPLHNLQPPATVTELGSAFDPKDCGTIVGRVLWDGPEPIVRPLDLPSSSLLPSKTKTVPNPNAPRIAEDRVIDAVVWLRGVEPSRSRPWEHPAVSVEATELELVTRQGEDRVPIGFVRRGEMVHFSAREPARYSIRGRGAAFFTDLLYDANRPTSRRLTAEGIVQVTGATGAYWHRSHLAVSDHPYLTRTDDRGEYQIPAVPAGTYDLVCWIPNWRIDRLERDPELVVHVRMVFGPDVEKKQGVRVSAGEKTSATFRLTEDDFKSSTGKSRPTR